MNKDYFSNICLGIFIGYLVGFLSTIVFFVFPLREEAVKHNVAEWVVTNPTNGASTFRWKGSTNEYK